METAKNLKPSKRLFTGIRIPAGDSLLKCYDDIREMLKEDNLKWVIPDNFHVTLKFLGSTPVEDIPGIISSIERSCTGKTPFTMNVSGVGTFRNKVIWMGLEYPEALMILRNDIEFHLKKYGEETGDKYNPHLTIARVKKTVNKSILDKIIRIYSGKQFQNVNAEEVILFESITGKKGPVYQPLKIFSLAL